LRYRCLVQHGLTVPRVLSFWYVLLLPSLRLWFVDEFCAQIKPLPLKKSNRKPPSTPPSLLVPAPAITANSIRYREEGNTHTRDLLPASRAAEYRSSIMTCYDTLVELGLDGVKVSRVCVISWAGMDKVRGCNCFLS
jgi:hypothetical protein